MVVIGRAAGCVAPVSLRSTFTSLRGFDCLSFFAAGAFFTSAFVSSVLVLDVDTCIVSRRFPKSKAASQSTAPMFDSAERLQFHRKPNWSSSNIDRPSISTQRRYRRRVYRFLGLCRLYRFR